MGLESRNGLPFGVICLSLLYASAYASKGLGLSIYTISGWDGLAPDFALLPLGIVFGYQLLQQIKTQYATVFQTSFSAYMLRFT